MRAGGVSPNLITFNAAISACAKAAQWQQALNLLIEIPATGIRPGAYLPV